MVSGGGGGRLILFKYPLLNTIELLSPGVKGLHGPHHTLMGSNFQQITQGLLITVLLGRYFTALQAFEYFEASFTFADRGEGSRLIT